MTDYFLPVQSDIKNSQACHFRAEITAVKSFFNEITVIKRFIWQVGDDEKVMMRQRRKKSRFQIDFFCRKKTKENLKMMAMILMTLAKLNLNLN
jgi:hypothetical protein